MELNKKLINQENEIKNKNKEIELINKKLENINNILNDYQNNINNLNNNNNKNEKYFNDKIKEEKENVINNINNKYNELKEMINNKIDINELHKQLKLYEYKKKINYKFIKEPQNLKYKYDITNTNIIYGYSDIFEIFISYKDNKEYNIS